MAQIKIPKEKVAIVLIEPQNDFLSEGGTMYAHIKEQLAERHVIANLQDLLEKARGQVAKIFYCPFHPFDPGFPELKKGGPACEGLAWNRDGYGSRLGNRRMAARHTGTGDYQRIDSAAG
ncbi:MAG: hypothetical protein ACLR8P_18300 [Clostridium fessum]